MNQRGFILIGLLVLTLLLGVVLARITGDVKTADDTERIKHTIEEAFRLRGEACIRSNHGREEEFRTELAEYWNNVRPIGEALATREYYSIPTNDPTRLAPYFGTAIAKGTIKNRTLGELLAYNPTPSWRPEYSPLEEQWSQITACQEPYENPLDQAVAFRLSTAQYRDISVSGPNADVLVDLTYSSDYEKSDGTIHTMEGTKPYQYVLELSDDGRWLILAEHLLEYGAP